MASSRKCIVCRFAEDEVDKLHYFPRNVEKAKLWLEAMGMVFSDKLVRSYRICSRHFASDAYVSTTFTLKGDACPKLLPATNLLSPTLLGHTSTSNTASATSIVEAISLKDESIVDTSPKSSTSRTPINVKSRSNIFKHFDMSSQQLTPKKRLLIDVINKKEDYLRKLKRECKRRGKNIKDLCNIDNSTVVKRLFKDTPLQTADFLISQLRCSKRNAKARRWTLDEKIVSLALHKRSPKCYALLRKLVALPSRRTLTTLLEKVPFDTGINIPLFQHVDRCLSSAKIEDRMCIILFDEMDIKEHIQYDKNVDRIRGFEDIGKHQMTTKFANKALVFMAQGLRRKWKQPLAYYFINGSCPANTLQTLLLEVLTAAKNIANLSVIVTVCDMGSNNVKALKDMHSSVSRPYIEHEGNKVFTMFDSPHLLKCTASLFRKHNVHLPIKIGTENHIMQAKFSDIVDAYKIDQNTPYEV